MDSRSEQTIEKIALNTEEVLSFCFKELCIPIDKIILYYRPNIDLVIQ